MNGFSSAMAEPLGRECTEPIAGVVQGIDRSGALRVDVGSRLELVRTGSLVLKEEA